MNDKQAMASAYKAQVARYGMPISDELYKELREYANDHSIRISGFRNYIGDIGIVKEGIDDIYEIGQDFPIILDKRHGVILDIDFNMSDDDFATTDSGHVIKLNAGYINDLDRLKKEYAQLAEKGHFVSNSDWHAIFKHETGHVVANLYNIDSLNIALDITQISKKVELFEYLKNELSLYSTAYEDGREIISECFSCYYSRVNNNFANEFVKRCMEISKKGGCQL